MLFPPEIPYRPEQAGVCRGGHGYQTSKSQNADQVHFHSNFPGAGSAYADVTFEDAWPLQLLCDYYLVYTPGHR
jgi:hypothetical protein